MQDHASIINRWLRAAGEGQLFGGGRSSRAARFFRYIIPLEFRSAPEAVGLRWWSTFDPAWANVTLFDRASDALEVEAVHELRLDDDAVREAAWCLRLLVAA